MSTARGRQDTVACRWSPVAPADQSFTRCAVMVRRHVGGRTWGWKEERSFEPTLMNVAAIVNSVYQ